jgi:hypothetical protein
MRKFGVSLIVVTIATVNTAWAAEYPKASDTTYETTIAGVGTMQNHYMSDGKGHMRSETTDQNGLVQISLMDYLQHTAISTMDSDGQKRFMKNPLPDYEGDDAFKKDAKDLGTKVIDNHPCHGYETTFKNGLATDTWIGDDTKCAVLIESVGPEQKTISKLKSWVNTAPSFSMSLPSDYKPYP